ncbi:MAG: diacylglycerol kinase family lipid kinase [Candidatus Latescibacteria bacterium]|nr:diacylglycerol kinase family lipid kinase [Candidatus Latescibacterota bacterium]
MPWALIANPAAGGGRGQRVAEAAAERLGRVGQPVDLRLTRAPGHATELARQAVQEGCERVVVCGGDGTIRQVLPALARTQIPLGLLPFGTGNDLARALGVPRRLDRALQVLLQGHPSPIDLGRVGEALFCTVAAFGFDAEISEAMLQGQIPFPGTAGYLYATLGHLFRFRPPQVRLEGEFGLFEGEVLLVATANTSYYGGGMKIAPDADPRDGKLEVCIIRQVPKWTVLSMLPRIFWGGHVRHPAVRVERTSWLRIHSTQPRLLHADGEFLGHTPATIEALPAALQVVLPAHP